MPVTLFRPPPRRALWAGALLAASVVWFIPVALLAGARPAGADPGPGIVNNAWPTDCNMRVGVVIDRSDSIKGASDANPALVRGAVGDLAERLSGTGASMAVKGMASTVPCTAATPAGVDSDVKPTLG